MNLLKIERVAIILNLSIALLVQAILPYKAMAQFGGLKKKMVQAAACGGGAIAGYKIGDKIAEAEAKKMKLGAAEADKQRRAFQIGMALALCGGGSAIAGTSYSRLSKRGKDARETEIKAALDDAMPHTYKDPDNPSLMGTVTTPNPTVVEGNEECRTVEDHLEADQALVKYCRPSNGGEWYVKT